MDEKEFKDSLGKLPTGISIITTIFEEQLFGFTANSFTSVSLSPPLISFCLRKNAGSIDAFSHCNMFAVSILAENQAVLSKQFSSSRYDQFLNVEYQIDGLSKCPLITGAVCWIECLKLHQYDGGDHVIFIGEVKMATVNNNLKPLIYFARNYWQLK